MSRRSKKVEEEGLEELSILEAVDNLSNIAELHGDDQIEVTEEHQILIHHGQEEAEHAKEGAEWVRAFNKNETEEVVKDTFRTVLFYVKDLYKKEYTRFYDKKNQEGIKKIMLLAGEAANKLNKYTSLFQDVHKEGVVETKEYRQLENFYKERVALESGDRLSLLDMTKGSHIEGASELTMEEMFLRHEKGALLGIDDIKEDKAYELIFMQKEDGGLFFDQSLIRDIRLVCEFGDFSLKDKREDPLIKVKRWYDYNVYRAAKNILLNIRGDLNIFYQSALKYKDMEIASCVSRACMALMLSANEKNLLEKDPQKCCLQYFHDFTYYLREAFTSLEYQKLKSYPPPESQLFLTSLVRVIHYLCLELYLNKFSSKGLKLIVEDLIEEGRAIFGKKEKRIRDVHFWDRLESDFVDVNRALQNYPSGPIYKIIDFLEGEQDIQYDPILQRNIPCEYFKMQNNEDVITFLRMPSPTHQETVQKVKIDEEFQNFLEIHSIESNNRPHLLINFQDRTSWKEYWRSLALEKMPQYAEFSSTLLVVTLSKDTDFYHQKGNYEELSDAKTFMEVFKEQMKTDDCGFYFPPRVREILFKEFVDDAFHIVHSTFLHNKKVLTQKERLNFIEIFYFLLELKLIDLLDPSSVCLTCKDSLDSGGSELCGLFSFLKIIKNGEFSKEDIEHIYLIIFGYPLYLRERTMQRDNFIRMIEALRSVQNVINDQPQSKMKQFASKIFGKLFSKDLFAYKLSHFDQENILKKR